VLVPFEDPQVEGELTVNPPPLPSNVALRALYDIARDYAWSWDPVLRDLLVDALGERWIPGTHPWVALHQLTPDERHDLGTLADRAVAAATRLPSRQPGPIEVAYFSPEFGVSDTLPQYAGGLGVLAGDHLKAASDLAWPLIGVGLFYTHGYFTQGLDSAGQAVTYETYRPADLALADTGATVSVEIPELGDVRARVWRADVGRVDLYLLDTNIAGNRRAARGVTDRLYGGDQAHRINQEWLLGVGGVRALRALGIHPRVYHLNEGHAGFLVLELLAEQLAIGLSLEQARDAIRPRTVFTTHTPVPAGIDRFPAELLRPYLDAWAERTGASADEIWELGRFAADPLRQPGDPESFNMAVFCLRNSGRANGVSSLHAEVSRAMFGSLPEGRRITAVTNGVHARTWAHPRAQDLFDTHLGKGWDNGEPAAWKRAADIDGAEILRLRRGLRHELVDRLARDHQVTGFDPDALTVGFARRFATYKRAALLLREADRLAGLLGAHDRPVQFVFAGKAHPADQPGQALVRQVTEFARRPEAGGRFVFVPGYDMALAAAFIAGCDVWLNNPVRPMEACGTSGEKAVLNGGLNCSVLDGWWAEWYHEANGWAIPPSEAGDPERRDTLEARAVLDLLEHQILPAFYRDPAAWTERIRAGWTILGPKVTAGRMLAEYRDRLYRPVIDGD
jgi:starch phosphorylase